MSKVVLEIRKLSLIYFLFALVACGGGNISPEPEALGSVTKQATNKSDDGQSKILNISATVTGIKLSYNGAPFDIAFCRATYGAAAPCIAGSITATAVINFPQSNYSGDLTIENATINFNDTDYVAGCCNMTFNNGTLRTWFVNTGQVSFANGNILLLTDGVHDTVIIRSNNNTLISIGISASVGAWSYAPCSSVTPCVQVRNDNITQSCLADNGRYFTPAFWNDGYVTEQTNNCYAYATNKNTGTYPQPGVGSGRYNIPPPNSPEYGDCDKMGARAVADGLIQLSEENLAACPVGRRVALVADPSLQNPDYHWYRQAVDGRWSHKPGEEKITNVDAAGYLIIDPRTANRDNRPKKGHYYSRFCSFYCRPATCDETVR